MTTAKLPESWRPEALLQSRAEALSKETGLPLVDAVDMLTAQTNIALLAENKCKERQRLLVLQLVKDLIATLNDISDNSEGRYPSPDPGCFECTLGTVPNRLNSGLCAYHAAKKLIAEVG